jgi:hypothetical protein
VPHFKRSPKNTPQLMKHIFPLFTFTLFALFSPCLGQSIQVEYSDQIEIRKLAEGKSYLTNRKYLIKSIPKELNGMEFTAMPGGVHKPIKVIIKKGTVVYIALDSEKKSEVANAIRDYSSDLEKKGWKYFGKIRVTDKRMKNLRILTKTFASDTTVELKGIGFVGSIIIASDLKIKAK